MKNRILKIVGTISITATLVSPVFSDAKTKGLALGSVTNETLGASPAAILPSNPFYSLTKAFGAVKGSFLTDKFSRLISSAEFLNRRAAELLKTYAVSPKNEKLVLVALQEYQSQLYQYTLSLNRLSQSGAVLSGENSVYENQLVLTIIHHTRFIDDIAGWQYLTNGHAAVLSDVESRLGSSAVVAISKLVGGSEFLSVITNGIFDQSFVEQIRTAEALSVLAKHAAARGENELAQKLLVARRDILVYFAENATSEDISKLSSIAGSQNERLKTFLILLDMPELRENSQLTDLKNQLLIQVF